MAIFSKRTLRNLGEKKRDMPEGLWHKCPSCSATIHDLELKRNLRVCTKCGHHFKLSADERIESLADEGTFEELDASLRSTDALGFQGYADRLERFKAAGMSEAVITGRMKIGGHPATLSVMDFRFLGASMGSVVGEKITRAIELATNERAAAIVVSASGGARMHEGILSLMQMAKTSGALARHSEAGLPYISILTDPTTGGVTASFAVLGDIIMAEPKCMIGFAGPRVVEQTTRQSLPPGFQTAEFMLEHGLVDMIVPRGQLRERIIQALGYLMPAAAV
ncbi:MAG: acetyl-CoA carboxylase, carboxyltransferase subunit beta [Verrucomicrobiales bacterium]